MVILHQVLIGNIAVVGEVDEDHQHEGSLGALGSQEAMDEGTNHSDQLEVRGNMDEEMRASAADDAGNDTSRSDSPISPGAMASAGSQDDPSSFGERLFQIARGWG